MEDVRAMVGVGVGMRLVDDRFAPPFRGNLSLCATVFEAMSTSVVVLLQNPAKSKLFLAPRG
jgi:hypothetical protein